MITAWGRIKIFSLLVVYHAAGLCNRDTKVGVISTHTVVPVADVASPGGSRVVAMLISVEEPMPARCASRLGGDSDKEEISYSRIDAL